MLFPVPTVDPSALFAAIFIIDIGNVIDVVAAVARCCPPFLLPPKLLLMLNPLSFPGNADVAVFFFAFEGAMATFAFIFVVLLVSLSVIVIAPRRSLRTFQYRAAVAIAPASILYLYRPFPSGVFRCIYLLYC